MFTPGQVSDMLDIPPSTLRRYAKLYAGHLSTQANKRRGRRYTEADITNLARVRELSQLGRSPDEIEERLGVIPEEDPGASVDASLALVPSISQALNEIQDVARSLKTELEDTQVELSKTQERQTATRWRLEEIEAWLRLPWWKRLKGPPGPGT